MLPNLEPAQPKLKIAPLAAKASLGDLAYEALKKAITEMDIYGTTGEIRLDERQLALELGVSRTPIREALKLLVQEGFVRAVPRIGLYVVRKSKREIIDMITVWAALESMAARLAATRASNEELRTLRTVFGEFETEEPLEHMTEYSEANIRFHQAIIRLGGCDLISEMTENLFIHMRAIRSVSIRQANRLAQSVTEHRKIIQALEARDAALAEALVREHALGLAEHVREYGLFPD